MDKNADRSVSLVEFRSFKQAKGSDDATREANKERPNGGDGDNLENNVE